MPTHHWLFKVLEMQALRPILARHLKRIRPLRSPGPLGSRLRVFKHLDDFAGNSALAIFHVLPGPQFHLQEVVVVKADGTAPEAGQETLMRDAGAERVLAAPSGRKGP